MYLNIGRFRIYPLLDGFFRLDGGRMFGNKPKTAWQQFYFPDEQNRITLAARCYLVVGKYPLLFDTGIGDPADPAFAPLGDTTYRDFFAIDQSVGNLITNLAVEGFGTEDISFVTQSHLHLDHTGWHTRTDKKGVVAPTFRHSRYLVHYYEWQEAMRPHPISRPSYRREAYAPLIDADPNYVKMIFADSYAIEPGLTLVRTGGHTHGHWRLMIESDGKKALLAGDLIPTHKHLVKPTNVMSYDLRPDEVYDKKMELLEQAARERWLILFDHDPDYVGGYVERDAKGFFRFIPSE